LLRQTLMNVDECFVYKIPPMSTSGGHRYVSPPSSQCIMRFGGVFLLFLIFLSLTCLLAYLLTFLLSFFSLSAEQWDLANPLQTCGFQVERRDNDLYLLFTTEQHTKLFALAKIHETIGKSIEAVVDSSRYFVTHISGSDRSRTTLIGFGFRERDVAIDLLGNLQQFQKSIEREQKAKNMKVAEIPKLAAGDKIHISFGTSKKKSTIVHNNNTNNKPTSSSSSSPKAIPLLLKKKPPKFTQEGERNIRLSMGELVLDKDLKEKTPSSADSEGAVALDESTCLDNGSDDDDDDDDWGGFQEAAPAPAP